MIRSCQSNLSQPWNDPVQNYMSSTPNIYSTEWIWKDICEHHFILRAITRGLVCVFVQVALSLALRTESQANPVRHEIIPRDPRKFWSRFSVLN
jgi:hypothetical protein